MMIHIVTPFTSYNELKDICEVRQTPLYINLVMYSGKLNGHCLRGSVMYKVKHNTKIVTVPAFKSVMTVGCGMVSC